MVGRLVEWNIAVVDATPVAGNKTNLLPAYAQVNSYAYSKMEFVKIRWYSSKIRIPLYDTYDSIFEDLCSVDLKYYASSCEGQPYVRQQRHNMVFSCINLRLNSSCTVSTLVQCLHFYVVRTFLKNWIRMIRMLDLWWKTKCKEKRQLEKLTVSDALVIDKPTEGRTVEKVSCRHTVRYDTAVSKTDGIACCTL